jgi:hypothetical protein
MFETALDHESEDQLDTFGEITLDKKISCYCPFNYGKFLDFPQVIPGKSSIVHEYLREFAKIYDSIFFLTFIRGL